MSRLLRAVAVVSLGVATSLAVAASPAAAATYDGTDPQSTHCADTAITAQARNIRNPANNAIVGVIELRYSRHCATAWARVVKYSNTLRCVPADVGCADALVYRNSDRREYSCKTRLGANSCYTRQVNDSHVTSYAEGSIDLGASWPSARTGSY
jgi:hypothetical protein